MIENSLEGFIAVRDILLLAPAEEIVAMFNTEELRDYLLENINLLLNFDSHCLFLKKDMYEKLLLIVNNGRFKTEKVNRLTQINYAIIKINTEKCHNNSIEEMNSYIKESYNKYHKHKGWKINDDLEMFIYFDKEILLNYKIK